VSIQALRSAKFIVRNYITFRAQLQRAILNICGCGTCIVYALEGRGHKATCMTGEGVDSWMETMLALRTASLSRRNLSELSMFVDCPISSTRQGRSILNSNWHIAA
jgi:hypothetical protein